MAGYMSEHYLYQRRPGWDHIPVWSFQFRREVEHRQYLVNNRLETMLAPHAQRELWRPDVLQHQLQNICELFLMGGTDSVCVANFLGEHMHSLFLTTKWGPAYVGRDLYLPQSTNADEAARRSRVIDWEKTHIRRLNGGPDENEQWP